MNTLTLNSILFALFVLALFALSEARADTGDVWVSPYSFTHHYRYKGVRLPGKEWKTFENSHPSLGIEYQDTEIKSFAAGVYHDSYGGTSVYLARHWRYGYGLGATTGVLIGPSYPTKFVPFVGPEVTINIYDAKLSFIYLSGFGLPKVPNLGVVQIAFKL